MYEYSTNRQFSGMGWSEISGWSNLLNPGGYCPGSDKDRRICAMDNAADRATMQAAGCIRPSYLNEDNAVDPCTTSGGNPGTVWCCPENNPLTPAQRLAAGQAAAPGSGQTATTTTTTTAGQETITRPIVNADLPQSNDPVPQQKTPGAEQPSGGSTAGGMLKAGSMTWKVYAVLGSAVFAYFGYEYLVSTGRI